MKMLISEAQAKDLMAARSLSRDARRAAKRRIFAQIRKDHGISFNTKLNVAIEDESNPLYRVLKDKRTKQPLDNGLPDPAVTQVAEPLVTEAKAPAKATKKAAPAKAPAKKVAAKAPAAKKTAAPAKKPAAKAAPVKAPAKKVAAKAPAKKAAPAAKSPAKKATR